MLASAAAAARPQGLIARWRERALRHAADDTGEVVLHHARIYILPTARGLAVGATLGVLLVTALNYGLALAFLAAFLLSGMAAAALLHTFRNLAGIAIRPGPVGETFAGGSLRFTLHVAARGRERIGIVVAPREGASALVDLAAEQSAAVVVGVPAPRRGVVTLGRVGIASDHPLGLWRGFAYVHFPLHGLAYPAPEAGAPPLPVARNGHHGDSALRHEDGELAGLRAYQHGDSLQRVAWKRVARGGGWYTKAFEANVGGGELVLDYRALPAALDAEAKLARLCAWVLACEHAARPCGLALPGRRVPAGAGREHRRALLTALAMHEAP